MAEPATNTAGKQDWLTTANAAPAAAIDR